MLLLSSLLSYLSSSSLFSSVQLQKLFKFESIQFFKDIHALSTIQLLGFMLGLCSFYLFTLLVCISAFSACISALSIHMAFSPGNAIFLVIISINADSAFTLLLFSSLLFSFLPYVFWPLTTSANFVLLKPFKYQNVQKIQDIAACIQLFDIFQNV